jgi:DNA gyrase subunit A
MRRAMAGVADDETTPADEDGGNANAQISTERYAEMSAAENLILTITAGGSGKLSSSHDYPVRGRGGMGVTAMDKAMRGGDIVASFPVELSDQIMLATSKGQSIRIPVDGISFRSRSAGGVRVFNTGAGEEVVSVAWIADQGDEDAAEDAPQTD